MLQRLQSIFLFLSSGSLASAFAFPFASASEGHSHPFFADQVFNLNDSVLLLVLFAVTAIILLINIFLFKNRSVQLNLCLLGFGMIGGIVGMLIYTLLNVEIVNFEAGLFTPLLALVFLIMAFIYIRKDDKLVKSMDRLR